MASVLDKGKSSGESPPFWSLVTFDSVSHTLDLMSKDRSSAANSKEVRLARFGRSSCVTSRAKQNCSNANKCSATRRGPPCPLHRAAGDTGDIGGALTVLLALEAALVVSGKATKPSREL